MKRGRLSQDEKNQILDLFAADISIEEISETMERSVDSVTKFLEDQADQIETMEAEVEADTEVDEPEPAQELKKRPKLGGPITKTGGGNPGVAVANQVSSEKMSSLSEKIGGDRGKLSEKGGYKIYAD